MVALPTQTSTFVLRLNYTSSSIMHKYIGILLPQTIIIDRIKPLPRLINLSKLEWPITETIRGVELLQHLGCSYKGPFTKEVQGGPPSRHRISFVDNKVVNSGVPTGQQGSQSISPPVLEISQNCQQKLDVRGDGPPCASSGLFTVLFLKHFRHFFVPYSIASPL